MLRIFRPDWSEQINSLCCLTWPAQTAVLLDHSHGNVLAINSTVLVRLCTVKKAQFGVLLL